MSFLMRVCAAYLIAALIYLGVTFGADPALWSAAYKALQSEQKTFALIIGAVAVLDLFVVFLFAPWLADRRKRLARELKRSQADASLAREIVKRLATETGAIERRRTEAFDVGAALAAIDERLRTSEGHTYAVDRFIGSSSYLELLEQIRRRQQGLAKKIAEVEQKSAPAKAIADELLATVRTVEPLLRKIEGLTPDSFRDKASHLTSAVEEAEGKLDEAQEAISDLPELKRRLDEVARRAAPLLDKVNGPRALLDASAGTAEDLKERLEELVDGGDDEPTLEDLATGLGDTLDEAENKFDEAQTQLSSLDESRERLHGLAKKIVALGGAPSDAPPVAAAPSNGSGRGIKE